MNEAQEKVMNQKWAEFCFEVTPTGHNEPIRVIAGHKVKELCEAVLSVSDGWIDVKERLPEEGEFVLVNLFTDLILKGRLQSNGLLSNAWSAFYADGEHFTEEDAVTHWMPLPSPPKDLPSSDGLEHSQHKCGCEEVVAEQAKTIELLKAENARLMVQSRGVQ